MGKRALLLLIGGRQIPNFLAAQHVRPDIIVPIASYEAMQEGQAWSRIASALQQLCPDGVEAPARVDAFDLQQVRNACRAAVERYSDAEWVFHVTCGTTIMSIGAYEVAQELGASAWYLDSATRRVVTLTGRPPEGDIYRVSVADYMGVYGRTPQRIGQDPGPALITFAALFARRPHLAADFKQALYHAGAHRIRANEVKKAQLRPDSEKILSLCQAAQDAGFSLTCERVHGGVIDCLLRGPQLYKFVEGGWLEVYAWAAARDAGCFDDWRYGIRIPGAHGRNELDLAATYAGSLLVAECKAEEKPFKTTHLDKLMAISSMLGGKFVGRLFVCSRFEPSDPYQFEEYRSFCGQAREREIVVVTGEQLMNLSAILRREAGADWPNQRPTFDRG